MRPIGRPETSVLNTLTQLGSIIITLSVLPIFGVPFVTFVSDTFCTV